MQGMNLKECGPNDWKLMYLSTALKVEPQQLGIGKILLVSKLLHHGCRNRCFKNISLQ